MSSIFKNLGQNLLGGGIPGLGVAAGAMGVAGGLMKTVGSLFGGGKRRREQRRAKKDFNRLKEEYTNLDTSNLMMGQDNVYEDLTVNQQEAQFLGEQQQQSLSNALNQNRTAAGGSGIASLAQAMANQQSKNLAASAISIGQQESQNQQLERQEAARIQQAEISGAYQERAAERETTETLLGMSGQRLAAANQARADAKGALFSGIGDIAGGALSMAAGGAFKKA
jgi:hypothetical protein